LKVTQEKLKSTISPVYPIFAIASRKPWALYSPDKQGRFQVLALGFLAATLVWQPHDSRCSSGSAGTSYSSGLASLGACCLTANSPSWQPRPSFTWEQRRRKPIRNHTQSPKQTPSQGDPPFAVNPPPAPWDFARQS